MYRQYENPHALQERLERIKEEYNKEIDIDRKIDLHETIAELEERINFAWQDIEYDENNAEDFLEFLL